jgi:tRNA A-37 threonylcarbamoyl transferase component Bud32
MPPRTSDYQSGHTIPGTVYRVHHVVGVGGMGTVYEVEDITVGKRYVLKTLHADLADRHDLAERLSREARALAKLQHPNIVEVYTSGTTQDALKLPFYVMERLHGESLTKVIGHRGSLKFEQACDIGIDLLDALDHAHEYRIIHRDVKPDNIFVTRGRDGRSLAKLLDFGIMKLASGPAGSAAAQTGGRFIGTFRYAAPEQILGREVTLRSDLYAAGLVLYEMLAGRGPFDDFTGEMEVGKAHIDVPPPPLSKFVDVPPGVEALVMSALQKDPAARPRDAFTFASGLREIKKQLALGVSLTRAKTVDRVMMQPASEARPFAEVSTALGPEQAGVTRIDGPGRVTHTVSLGVLPTFAAAPLTAAGDAQPMAQGAIDRRAETREAVHRANPEPNNDTAPIPLVAPRRVPADPLVAQGETFGPHTTAASQRKVKARSTFLMLGGAIVVVAASLVTLTVWRHHVVGARAESAPSTSERATGTAVVTLPVVADPSTSTVGVATAQPTDPVKPSATATHKTLPTSTVTSTTQATAAPPSTASTHRRPGSGL